jgi:hypothetical protein
MAQHSEQAAHLGERLSARLLDRNKRFAGRLLSRPERKPLCPGLHDHHADAVSDHVVELARDSSALLGDCQSRGLLLFPLECRGPRLQRGGQPLPVAEEPTRQPDAGVEGAGHDEVVWLGQENDREADRAPE